MLVLAFLATGVLLGLGSTLLILGTLASLLSLSLGLLRAYDKNKHRENPTETAFSPFLPIPDSKIFPNLFIHMDVPCPFGHRLDRWPSWA